MLSCVRLGAATLLVFAMTCLGVDVPQRRLLNGRDMPAIALGTYLGFDKTGIVKPKNNELRDAVLYAIDIGYRHIDTASVYETEAEVGEAIRMKIDEGVLKREDIFVTTKVWNTHHKREQVAFALKESLEKLGLNYVDLYLMHWPIGLNEDYSFSDVDYMETWRGLEDVYKLGLAKSIGVSNFNKEQLIRVLTEGNVKPVALEIEVHPQIIQKDLISFAESEGIVVMGYSPFGSLVKRFGLLPQGLRMDDPLLQHLATKYDKTPAQIVLRWQVDRGVVPIPKSVNPARLEMNIAIFDFKLEPEEIASINRFDSGTRFTLPSFWQAHPYYPFEKVQNPLLNPFKTNSE